MANNLKDEKSKVLWLDPVSPLSVEETSVMEGMGLKPMGVMTIDDLKRAVGLASLAVIRLVKDASH